MPICVIIETEGNVSEAVETWYESDDFRSFVDEYLSSRYYEYELETKKKRKEVYRVFYDDDKTKTVTFEQTWA